MKEYDKILNREVNKILRELYYNSLNTGGTKIKRAVVEAEKRYVDYLEELELIKRISQGDRNGKWGMQLERKGFEVFEKYNGWFDYRKRVIDKTSKVEKAREIATRFWWIPIFISFLAFIISIIALFKK